MEIINLLEMALQRGASDLHLKSGGPPVFRINGELFPDKDTGVLDGSEIAAYFDQITTAIQKAEFSAQNELDFLTRQVSHVSVSMPIHNVVALTSPFASFVLKCQILGPSVYRRFAANWSRSSMAWFWSQDLPVAVNRQHWPLCSTT